MERTMTRFTLLLFVALLGGADRLAAQEKVEARGITSVIKLEEVTFGHLTELNGKFKMRATEFTFAPGAYLGVHHHIGPGIRYILSGELTFYRREQDRPAASHFDCGDSSERLDGSCGHSASFRMSPWPRPRVR
jgi:hypothetical protein